MIPYRLSAPEHFAPEDQMLWTLRAEWNVCRLSAVYTHLTLSQAYRVMSRLVEAGLAERRIAKDPVLLKHAPEVASVQTLYRLTPQGVIARAALVKQVVSN